MNRFDSSERAPLEFTKVSSKTTVLVCPNCKYSRTTSVDTVGLICSKCNKYFSAKDSLKEFEAVGLVNTNIPINKEFTKLKSKMEKEAYEWRDDQAKQGKLGVKSHEPDGKARGK